MLNILIMAGGKGERFWPKSRMRSPKQLLNLTGNGSMIQETVRRVQGLTPLSHIFVVTNPAYAQAIRAQLPEIPAENIILEPEGRNTAPCIGLASLFIERQDPDGVMAVLASDHLIKDQEGFCQILRTAALTASETDGIVTLGVRPDRPETGYGYIKIGRPLTPDSMVFKVERFTEKPDLQTAVDFLANGKYLWNSGMFVWKVSTIRRLFAKLMPDLHQGLEVIKAAFGSAEFEGVLKNEFSKFEKISIDYGIMERAPEVFVIPADIGWDDVGSWTSLQRIWPVDSEGNVISGTKVTLVDTKNCIFETQDKLVAAVGLRDLIFVETPDVILLCPKQRAQDVKLILEKLKGEGKEEYL